MNQKLLDSMIKTKCLVLLLCIILLIPGAHAAEPGVLFNEGFEHWQGSVKHENGVINYEIICPEADLSVRDLENYMLHIMSYSREKNPSASRVTIRFPYQGANFMQLSSEVQKMFSIDGGIRAVSSSFMNLSSCRLQSDSNGDVKTVIFQLDVNNPNSTSIYARNIPFGESLDAVRNLAAGIQAQSSEPWEQLRLLNEYLIEHVDYGYEGEEGRAHSPVGALSDGKAMCAGYAATVQDVCYLLGIPSYQLYDRKNLHIWNVVLLDGQWLMLDVTFNDTSNAGTQFFLLSEFSGGHHAYTTETRARLADYAMEFHTASVVVQQPDNTDVHVLAKLRKILENGK